MRIQSVLILAATLILSLMGSTPLYAAGGLFTIENVKVDVSASNAIEARKQAFEKAQASAFEELAMRMLSQGELQTFQAPKANIISRMIQDFEVSNEKLASTRYIGTYKFRFKDRDVKRFFAGVTQEPVTASQSAPKLMLPFFQIGGRTVLWSQNNPWLEAWNNSESSGGLVPIILPIGDLSDVQDISDDEALTYQTSKLNAMLRRYNASEAVIAIAKQAGDGSVGVEIFRTDRGAPEFVQQIRQPALAAQSSEVVMGLAASKVKAALGEDWKQRAGVRPEDMGAGLIEARVQFQDFVQWAQIQKSLNTSTVINDMQIKALSPREAYIQLRFDGRIDRLRLALQQYGLSLGEPRYPYANAPQRGLLPNEDQGTPVYDIYQMRPRSPYGSPLSQASTSRAQAAAQQPRGYQAQF